VAEAEANKIVFLIKGPRRSARLHLDGPFFVVGRGEPFPVFHDDPTLSREHAAVVDTDDGYLLKDLGSRNGVHLNGERLDRYAEVAIDAGDSFQAGDTTVVLMKLSVYEAQRAQAALSASSESSQPITVDAEGHTGFDPQPMELSDSDVGGEITGALDVPGDLILDPGGADDDWANEKASLADLTSQIGAPQLEEPEELGEEDLLEEDLSEEDLSEEDLSEEDLSDEDLLDEDLLDEEGPATVAVAIPDVTDDATQLGPSEDDEDVEDVEDVDEELVVE
jgi:pSer/pThr/pTyr-binding forkhead associated (FHA) protein